MPPLRKSPLQFEVVAKSGQARAAILNTRRGPVLTPTFMPVATHAHVRTLSMDEVAAVGARICLANTYHLLLRPGPEVFRTFKGIHRFMQWPHGVLTDSGGFQIFSLPSDREITEEAARFVSPYDNHVHVLSPESSIAMQQAIDADIMMVLDVCVPSTSDEAVTRSAMERTGRWALRSLKQRDEFDVTGQAIFGIVQGGVFEPLRKESAAFLTAQHFDGFAIGGLAVGESREQLYDMTAYTAPLLPETKPRYLMGVGTPIDLIEAVHRGVDMFDCIIPTKMAQQGYAYTFSGQLRIARTEFRFDETPLDMTCQCQVCTRYSKSYLRHLAQGNHALASRFLAIHNEHHYQVLMTRMRTAIVEGRWESEYKTLVETQSPKRSKPQAVKGSRRGNFELVTTKNGARAVRHVGHGEIMHPVGPWTEANALYVEQLRIKERLQEQNAEPLRILDVGLGAGTNALAVLTCAKGLGDVRQRALEIVSLENDLDAFALAMSDPEGFPFLTPFQGACRQLLEEHQWESGSISWRLFADDARQSVEALDGTFDLVLFDPFSPEKNGGLWTLDFLKAIRSRTWRQDGMLATYSAATPTRVALLLSGFYVGHGVATGSKSETTIAASRLDQLAEPLSTRWLERWQRSSARGSHDEAFSPELHRRVMAHPQFKDL
jgi:queuine tRNA-ribosyltransferase